MLPQLYEQVFIPDIVRNELVDQDAPAEVQRWMNQPPDWLIVSSVAQSADADLLELDPGERAAILLAEQLSATLLLIDERKGRSIARHCISCSRDRTSCSNDRNLCNHHTTSCSNDRTSCNRDRISHSNYTTSCSNDRTSCNNYTMSRNNDCSSCSNYTISRSNDRTSCSNDRITCSCAKY